MKIYEIRFEGSYLGGVAIVRARSKKKAVKYLKDEYMYATLPEYQQAIRSVTRIGQDDMLYIWDGDY